MLRIVTENVEKPALFMLCDLWSCGQYATIEITPGASADKAQSAFLGFLSANGWGISFARQLCPSCFAQAKGEQRLVQPVSRIVTPN